MAVTAHTRPSTEAMLTPIRALLITMGTLKLGDTLAGMWTAMEGQIVTGRIVGAKATVRVEILRPTGTISVSDTSCGLL